MASRLIDWTLAHLLLMWAFVGLTFVVMLFIPDARWNAITTVWGALFLGLLISLVLEQRGEGIQRRAWLRQNADRARAAIDELLAVAAPAAASAVDLPQEVTQALMSGTTRAARHEAADRARTLMWEWTQPPPGTEDNPPLPADELLESALQATQVRQRHNQVLSRTTQVDTALDRFLEALHWYEAADVTQYASSAEDTRTATAWMSRWKRQRIGEAAIRLCEACADLLFEARLLPP
jgi:hypothetical protein